MDFICFPKATSFPKMSDPPRRILKSSSSFFSTSKFDRHPLEGHSISLETFWVDSQMAAGIRKTWFFWHTLHTTFVSHKYSSWTFPTSKNRFEIDDEIQRMGCTRSSRHKMCNTIVYFLEFVWKAAKIIDLGRKVKTKKGKRRIRVRKSTECIGYRK